MNICSLPDKQSKKVDPAAYAPAVIAAIGARAAFDFDPNPETKARLLETERALRQIRDEAQRAAAKNAGL